MLTDARGARRPMLTDARSAGRSMPIE